MKIELYLEVGIMAHRKITLRRMGRQVEYWRQQATMITEAEDKADITDLKTTCKVCGKDIFPNPGDPQYCEEHGGKAK